MKQKKTFSEKLADLMERAELNATQLAKESGVSPQAISHYLHGDREPGLQHLRKLAKALGVSLSEFDAVAERVERESEVANA